MDDFDLSWLLLALPVTFALGWLASRLDLRQWRRDSRDAPRAYYKGLNLLLNEQQDQAIDAFIEAVQSDPDTVELHFALGNLFRRRGDFDRAVRVHEHLLSRPDLKTPERQRAQRALALDYMKAGLFDRAEQAWQLLLGTPHETEAQQALLSLHERSREWARASVMARALHDAGRGDFTARLAHHACERAEEADRQGQTTEGDAALAEALAVAPEAPRPLVLAGQRRLKAGAPAEALALWDRLREQHPAAFTLVARDYARAALAAGQTAAARVALDAAFRRHPGLDVREALTLLQPEDTQAAAERLSVQLRDRPTLSAAAEAVRETPPGWPEAAWQGVQRAVAEAARQQQRYRCAACGFEAQHYFWQCPGCLSWDSYPALRIEET